MKSTVIALLFAKSTEAARFRPTPGSVPWGPAPATRPTWHDVDGDANVPRDYFVPNFGVDHNILTTQNSLRIAEAQAKKTLKASFAQNDTPADMRTPDLGADVETKQSLAALSESEKENNSKMSTPDIFGQTAVQYSQNNVADIDVTDASSSIAFAEKHLGQQFANSNFSFDHHQNPESKNFGDKDEEISMAQANIAESEKMYGKFVPVQDDEGLWKVGKEENLVQLDKMLHSDPICSSAGCDQYKHKLPPRGYPINYPVPNLGMDVDVKGSLANMPVAEGIVGKKWDDFGTDASKARWANPAKKTLYDYNPELDGNMKDSLHNLSDTEKKLNHEYKLLQLESDPICNSSGCDQYKHPDSKVADWPRDYGVPSFGMDRGIMDSLTNLGVAEKITGQKWNWDSDKYKSYYKAADTMYNFAPKLDGDIVTSQANLAATEKVLSRQYNLS